MDSVQGSPSRKRAMSLLFTIPERFHDQTHMDQKSFCELSDWIVAHVQSQVSADVSVEESLFVFLEVVAQGNSFSSVAYRWDHNIQLTQSIFLNVLNALTVLRESAEIAETCPPFTKGRKRWEVARKWPRNRSRIDGLVKVGYDEMSRDGLEVNQESLQEALMALNNWRENLAFKITMDMVTAAA